MIITSSPFISHLLIICCVPGAVLGGDGATAGNNPCSAGVSPPPPPWLSCGPHLPPAPSGAPASVFGNASPLTVTYMEESLTHEGCGCCRRTPELSGLSSCWHHQPHEHYPLPGLRGARVQPGTRGRPAEDRIEFWRACVIPVSDRSKSPDCRSRGTRVLGGESPLE